MIFLLFSYNKHVYCVVHCIHVDYILCKHCVVMTDTKKEKKFIWIKLWSHGGWMGNWKKRFRAWILWY